ncbi:hypothetical protein CALCODRAFT_557644 [Calocera cornea HHB12733]|uniref:Uncharacterized protein n=1 Tax=Calocera cornea HHB12733 TaxID=1353952 RepID=A0A165DNY6_9BASI|nr:hypothetical protein CALCODRAFT_557644 [Calocera cornea HHB12733]
MCNPLPACFFPQPALSQAYTRQTMPLINANDSPTGSTVDGTALLERVKTRYIRSKRTVPAKGVDGYGGETGAVRGHEFPNTVAATIFAAPSPLRFHMSTDITLPDLISFSADTSAASGTVSEAFLHEGTFGFEDISDLLNIKHITCHAENGSDALTVTFYEDKSQGEETPQRGRTLGQYLGAHRDYTRLDLDGLCSFTPTYPELVFLSDTVIADINIAIGTSVQLYMRTNHEGCSCVCRGENEAESQTAKSISTTGDTFYCGDWSQLGSSDDYDYTFTLRRVGREKTIFATFLSTLKADSSGYQFEIGWLPLKGLHYEGTLTVDGSCKWSKP